MTKFLEIGLKKNLKDFKGEEIKEKAKRFLNLNIDQIRVRKLYAFDIKKINNNNWKKIKEELIDNVVEEEIKNHKKDKPSFVIKIGFNPGVTDNEGRTVKDMVEDILDEKISSEEKVYTSMLYLIYDKNINYENISNLSENLLANKLIEDIKIFDKSQWHEKQIFELPKIDAKDEIKINTYNLNMSDEDLKNLSKKRMLALNVEEMKTIKDYFNLKKNKSERQKINISENITDAELELLAQTWSEHCKHKIFASNIKYEDKEKNKKEKINSIFNTYIVGSANEVRKESNHLVSLFHDNAGVITFNENKHVCYKVETHNSPSALDPYGGAMTGIVGVNRDILGTGRGAVPHINVWGYCFGNPRYEGDIPDKLMHPFRIREGVHKGVIEGGNQSGIPYGRGWELFDDRYMGKPLVFCGTVGVLPREIDGIDSSKKWIHENDKIVMVGGRVGKDGIHGATFSSQELNEDSPVQAVQIGDPITQKKMSDFLIEARDKNLINFVQDNGAGGLASSVGEMAEETNGAYMDLEKVPLKYHGLKPWEILISEAQERMTFAIAPEKIGQFLNLAEKREVEASVIGHFTKSGYFHVVYGDKNVCYLDVEFLHDGLPPMELEAEWVKPSETEVKIDSDNLKKDILNMISGLNLSSKESKMRQYDHEVKGLTVIKPFIGKESDVINDISLFAVEYNSYEGLILSEGINPYYSDIDTYHMTGSIIDEAYRKLIVAGADPHHLAGLDNFCWPDPIYDSEKNKDGKYKLAQLVRSAKAIYDYTSFYKIPCISGKDSMKNDAVLNGEKISIPPTLLFSGIGKIKDYRDVITMDFSEKSELIYLLGKTKNELGQSQFYIQKSIKKGRVPRVEQNFAKKIYKKYRNAYQKNLVESAHSPHKGGIAFSLLLQFMASHRGFDIDLSKIPTEGTLSNTKKLFSESNSRIIVTINRKNREEFEKIMEGIPFSIIGTIKNNKKVDINYKQKNIFTIDLDEAKKSYKETFNG